MRSGMQGGSREAGQGRKSGKGAEAGQVGKSGKKAEAGQVRKSGKGASRGLCSMLQLQRDVQVHAKLGACTWTDGRWLIDPPCPLSCVARYGRYVLYRGTARYVLDRGTA
eukprot:364026-Chlamydomonas_euryale.AAC.4